MNGRIFVKRLQRGQETKGVWFLESRWNWYVCLLFASYIQLKWKWILLRLEERFCKSPSKEGSLGLLHLLMFLMLHFLSLSWPLTMSIVLSYRVKGIWGKGRAEEIPQRENIFQTPAVLETMDLRLSRWRQHVSVGWELMGECYAFTFGDIWFGQWN